MVNRGSPSNMSPDMGSTGKKQQLVGNYRPDKQQKVVANGNDRLK